MIKQRTDAWPELHISQGKLRVQIEGVVELELGKNFAISEQYLQVWLHNSYSPLCLPVRELIIVCTRPRMNNERKFNKEIQQSQISRFARLKASGT